MDNIVRLQPKERAELFSETAARKAVSPAIIEKDFWVCWVLQKIFSEPKLTNKLLFKGGTSLSKVFHVIERFSEDIDLVLNWTLICREDPIGERSKSKQYKLNQEINHNAKIYITETLLPIITSLCKPYCSVSVDDEDNHCLNVAYPRSFAIQYIRPEVRLEIGPLASWLPHRTFTIAPYIADYFPQFISNTQIKVNAIEAHRTFWEKATILHHEANRPDISKQPRRYSRHYYDLALLAKTEVKEKALSDLSILYDVIAFKKKFYNRGWANYDLAVPGSLKLIPSPDMKARLESDYQDMKDMIFGEIISFQDIIQTLALLENEINSLKINNNNYLSCV